MATSGENRRSATNGVKAYCCRPCPERCDVLLLAAVGETTRVWKCPMMLGTELMDRAVALALIRAAYDDTVCVVIRIPDVEPPDGC